MHVPPEQPSVQTCPHEPQLESSFCVSVHTPPHAVVPEGHAHDPPVHAAPPLHATQLGPQWFASELVS
jgi:hypothetical protein